ncbi:MAG: hypothetical protein AAF721_24370 [Myxococcota bacterium]
MDRAARRRVRTVFLWLVGCAGVPACERDDASQDVDDVMTEDQGEPMGCEDALGSGACASLTICDVFDCGGKAAPYNHFGCARTPCLADSECGSGERCFAVALESGCRAETGACTDQAGTCECAGAESCGGVVEAHCLPVGFYPASEDCQLADLSCDALQTRLTGLDQASAAFEAVDASQLIGELATCRDRVVLAQSTCDDAGAP